MNPDAVKAELKRIDQILDEREKQVAMALSASQHAIEKSEQEGLRAREAANEWRAAMSDRDKQFATRDSHDLLESQVDYLRRAMDTSSGRRAAWVAAAGIIATLMAIGIGQVLRQNLNAADVSQQIIREAPWNRDKAQIERRISELEHQQQLLEIQINRLQQRVLLLDGRK